MVPRAKESAGRAPALSTAPTWIALFRGVNVGGRNLLPMKALAALLAEQGLDVTSIDFSEAAQAKAVALAKERGVTIKLIHTDVHAFDYPPDAFDVVVEIFTQFSTPEERPRKWAGMRRALKSGGLLILQGYTPKQLEYGTGGPKEIERLYTRAMLEHAFAGFRDMTIVEEEIEIREGSAHGGMSAVISLTARKP